jgi:hypothetical protein
MSQLLQASENDNMYSTPNRELIMAAVTAGYSIAKVEKKSLDSNLVLFFFHKEQTAELADGLGETSFDQFLKMALAGVDIPIKNVLRISIAEQVFGLNLQHVKYG